MYEIKAGLINTYKCLWMKEKQYDTVIYLETNNFVDFNNS